MGFDIAGGEALIRHQLTTTFGLHVSSINIIHYDPACLHEYNNFIFDVQLQGEHVEASARLAKLNLPGTKPLPPTAKRLIARISNPLAADVWQNNRVENEVAAMVLAQGTLDRCSMPHLIPDVYFWSPADSTPFRWILMEHRDGVNYIEIAAELNHSQREAVLIQLAKIYAAMQSLQIPDSVEGYGGLTFDTAGTIVSGHMTVEPIKRAETYTNFLQKRLRAHTSRAVDCNILSADDPEFILRRIETLQQRVSSIVSQTKHLDRKVLVHGGLSLDNILLDPQSYKITGFLDFDFGYIGTFLDEFMSGHLLLPIKYASVKGPLSVESDPLSKAVRTAIITGRWDLPDGLSADEDLDNVDNVKIWYAALHEAGGRMPCELGSIEQLSALYELTGRLTPRIICDEVAARQRTDPQHQQDLQDARDDIKRSLTALGV